jgi:hypothetical protein
VSDCGLLRLQSEQAASDGDPDLSMLEEWRASKLRQLSAVDDAGLRCLLENKKNEEELAWLLQEQDTRVPDVPAIDYAAEMGINIQSVRARAREAAEREGTGLRVILLLLLEHSRARALSLSLSLTHTHTHKHKHIHIHTYIHTCIHT